MVRPFAGLVAILAVTALGTLASSTPTLEATVCVATDKQCTEPVHGLPLEAYLMNADGAWEAASPVVDRVQAQAGGSSGATVSALGAQAGATASGSASTRERPMGPAADGRSHAFPCPSSTACPDLSPDGVELARTVILQSAVIVPGDCNVEEGNTVPGHRWLLRFTTASVNVGDADAYLGDPTQAPSAFEWGLCHQHWHFLSYAEYRLWNLTAYNSWRDLRAANPNATSDELLAAHPDLASQRAGVGHKQGFCVIDVTPYQRVGGTPYKYDLCTDQGISPGWADTYVYGLDGQFIDVTDVPSGHYVLEIEVNTERAIEEASYGNDVAAVRVFLPELPTF